LIEAIDKFFEKHNLNNQHSFSKPKEAFEQYVKNLKSEPTLNMENLKDLKDLIQAFKGSFHNKKQDGSLNAYQMKTIDNCRIGALRYGQPVQLATCWPELTNEDYTDFRRSELATAKTFFESKETDDNFCEKYSVCFWHVMPKAFKNITASYEKLFGSFYILSALYFAETAQLYYLPIVSETGILEINDLNKAIANSIGLVGISLDRTNYDGRVNETTLSSVQHDVAHAEEFGADGFTAGRSSSIDRDKFCTVLMNFYNKCKQIHRKLIENESNLNTQQKSEDQLVFFFMGHENYLSHNKSDKDYITRAEFCKAVDSASSLLLGTVNDLQSTRSKKTTHYQEYNSYLLDGSLGEFNLVLNLPEPRFEPMSFVEFVQDANAEGANIPLDQPLFFERTLANDQRFSYAGYHAFDLIDYNLLLDYINMLPPENNLRLWEEDGEIDFLKIKRSFKRIFEDFKNRYKDQFPED
jgi:hypothetical protein